MTLHAMKMAAHLAMFQTKTADLANNKIFPQVAQHLTFYKEALALKAANLVSMPIQQTEYANPAHQTATHAQNSKFVLPALLDSP